jgi:hypothetical protein
MKLVYNFRKSFRLKKMIKLCPIGEVSYFGVRGREIESCQGGSYSKKKNTLNYSRGFKIKHFIKHPKTHFFYIGSTFKTVSFVMKIRGRIWPM